MDGENFSAARSCYLNFTLVLINKCSNNLRVSIFFNKKNKFIKVLSNSS
jgi:hypothetical protein